ncbi:MAG: bacteriohemerythrin [Rhodospirillales bacterium]|nr:bacteriohemerythrin [Rhodospirillales bacterium]
MSELEWKESWSVGYNLLDEDHMVLINIINQVKASQENNKPIDWVLQDLSDYVDLHFSREEEMMHIVGYSGFDEHVKEHRSFVEWLNTVKFSFNNNPQAKHYIADTVLDYLEVWLKNHILHTDMNYKGKL